MEPFADVSLVLRAHLPYAPPGAPEEDADLFRALTFCYLPVLARFAQLAEEGVPFRVALALSPALLARLDEPDLYDRYSRALDRAEAELLSHGEEPRPALDAARARLDASRGDVPGALAALMRAGHLELLPCGLSHAILPLVDEKSRKLQARAALDLFADRFGGQAQGLWLPGCAYAPGVESALSPARYTIVEAHGLTRAAPRALWGPFAPAAAPNGFVFFARDPDAERQWFGRESGFWQDGEYQPPPIASWPPRAPVKARNGALYSPELAARRASLQATQFVQEKVRAGADLGQRLRRPPTFTLAFELERFGLSWAEGPLFLEALLRTLAREPRLRLRTPAQLLAQESKLQALRPPASSWAETGGFEPWTTPDELSHLAGCQRVEAQLRAAPPNEAARQARRELALAYASTERPLHQAPGEDMARAKTRRAEHLQAASRCATLAARPVPEAAEFLRHRATRTPRWSLA